MPCELSFVKPVQVADSDIYINDCCFGGDVIRDELLPDIKGAFGEVDTGQEDWGWFLWIRRDALTLAVDIYCDDSKAGAFRIRLTSRTRRFLRRHSEADTLELDKLRSIVLEYLARSDTKVEVRHFLNEARLGWRPLKGTLICVGRLSQH